MHEISERIVRVPIASLHISATNLAIHADFDPHGRDAWLVEDIRQHGILLPLLVHADRSVEDGRRRLCCAKFLKLDDVPVIVLTATENGAAFSSAQLARHMTLYAKCVLYRERLADLIRRGETARERNLTLRHSHEPAGAGGCNADDSVLHQDWIKCEEVLGVSRRYLLRGIKLLEALEAMAATGAPDNIDRSTRILSIFRNRGLGPARRMLGESDNASDDGEPDCIDWQADADEADDKPAKRGRSKSTTTPGVVKFAKKDEVPADPWVTEIVKCLGRIETLAKQNKAYSATVKSSLHSIETEITGGSQKRAA